MMPQAEPVTPVAEERCMRVVAGGYLKEGDQLEDLGLDGG
jgi:hypothetical protein